MAQSNYATSAILTSITGANAKPCTNLVPATCAGLLARLTGHRPPRIPLNPNSSDIEEGPIHAKRAPSTPSAHLTAVLNDTKENLPSGPNSRQGDALLSDLVSAVSDIAGRVP
jgi:hypothetical protein